MTLVKEHSREYSLFQVVSYCDIFDIAEKEVGYKPDNELFYYHNDLVSVYHDPVELKKLFESIGKKAQDEGFVNQVLNNFQKSSQEILPFLKKEKTVSSVEELKDLWDLFLDFYKGIAYIWVIPNLDFVEKSIRDKAMRAREETEQYSSMRDKLFDANLKQIYPELGDLVHFLAPDEVFNNQVGESLKSTLLQRSDKYLYFKRQIVTGDKVDVFLEENDIELVDSLDKNSSNEIRGAIAQKGVIRGTVRLVFTGKDMSKVQDGDILVSPMTRPEFLPAMKRAAAFVTDEGGITCHAAIVAREMKKPCIIGTKTATSVLKDGDKVEVDADEGVVTIL